MIATTHLQCLLGGFGISLAAHQLLLLNGSVLGVSGFVHHCHRGSLEDLACAAGIILSGIVFALLDGQGPAPFTHVSLGKLVLSGLLVGLGSKLANGCTSGHMICGISRLSTRSIAATTIFFATSAAVVHFLYQDNPAAGITYDWTLSEEAIILLGLQAIPFAIAGILFLLAPVPGRSEATPNEKSPLHTSSTLRALACIVTNFQFGIALILSTLSEPTRVLNFLLLPFHRTFDPSLLFVAVSALPLGIFLYHFARGSERSRVDGSWSIPTSIQIDAKLVIGSAIFGVGWGISGICPGPGLVGLGRALGSNGRQLAPYAAWLSSFIAGGLLV